MFKNLDIKTILIIILGVSLILMFIFRSSNSYYGYEDELNKLKIENKFLFDKNDKLKIINDSLNRYILLIDNEIDDVDSSLSDNGSKISDLEDGKDQISDYVRVLSANGVAIELSSYLKRRENKGNN